jgi:hypothetical protein
LFDDTEKYVFGYEALELLERRRRRKPKKQGDRYHTKEFGQALRYGQYAVVAVCTNLGTAQRKKPAEALEAILMQWRKFEAWARKLQSNSSYKSGPSFSFVNYYKGSTINVDLRKYKFWV